MKKDGVILLLVVVILTAIFSISLGVLSVVLNQTVTSETFESSGIALFAADQSIERTLYRDRQENDFSACTPTIGSPCTTQIPAINVASGGCMSMVTIIKTTAASPPPPVITQITAPGLSTSCAPALITERPTARAFRTTY